jgi:Rab-like protein 2
VRLPPHSALTSPHPTDFWDTAGQESFNRLHPSYYYRAHCCILVFDVTRKITYQHLQDWYDELREYCPSIPCVLVANKIDVDYNVLCRPPPLPHPSSSQVTRKNFKFAAKNNLPFFFVSAADGTNVVKVFQTAIIEARRFKAGGGDLLSDMLELLGDSVYLLLLLPLCLSPLTEIRRRRRRVRQEVRAGVEDVDS